MLGVRKGGKFNLFSDCDVFVVISTVGRLPSVNYIKLL